MSRTFRRKNIEATMRTSWEVRGKKYFGLNTEPVYDWYWYRYWSKWKGETLWYKSTYIAGFRESTEEEKKARFLYLHGESKHANARTPSKYFRKARNRENRSINKQELIKWIKNEDYEPLFESGPRSHWWDWS